MGDPSSEKKENINMTTHVAHGPAPGSGGSQMDLKESLYRYFRQECTQLQEQIQRLDEYSLAGGEKQDAIDHVLSGISRLANSVKDSSEYITAYDQRTYSQAIKALEDKLESTRARFAPKSRFQFKTTQKNSSALSINDAAQMAAQQLKLPPSEATSNQSSLATTPADLMTPPGETDNVGDLPSFLPKNYNAEMSRGGVGKTRKPSFSQASNINITGHIGLHIILPSSASRATASGSVTNLDGCIVDMSIPTANSAPFAGIALKSIKNSLIIAGHVAGAAHITGVEDSILVVASRQVRMHECKNVDVYLHCASRPIIEDCHNVRFAPIPQTYVTDQEPGQNQWNQVDDFKWLKAEHSPNWKVLPEEQRIKEDIWTNVVPGGPGVGLDDILKKIGITARPGSSSSTAF